MVSFRALASASVISVAACEWCYTHIASQIFDENNSPGMLPAALWRPLGLVAAFAQDDVGTRYFAGLANLDTAMVVKSTPDEHMSKYDTHSTLWSWPSTYSLPLLAVTRDGSSVFMAGEEPASLRQCRPSDQIPPGPCIEISRGITFRGLAYDDENEDLYATTRNVVKKFRRAANRQWVNKGIVAGNADGGPRADLTGLDYPGALSFYEGDLFILDQLLEDYHNHRIVRWTPTEARARSEYKPGVQLGRNALSVYDGKIYFLELPPGDATVTSMEVVNPDAPKKKVAGGCGRGRGDNQLSGGVFTRLYIGPPHAGRLVILDGKRVVEWELNPPALSDKGGPLLHGPQNGDE